MIYKKVWVCKMYKLISTSTCQWCDQAEELLKSKDIPYEKIVIDTAPEDISVPIIALMQKNNLKEVPQLFTSDGLLVGNFDQIQSLVNSYNGGPPNSAGWSIKEEIRGY